MSMPVRLSDDLMDLAKQAAEDATRSLTAQVEHWALIGRAVEKALDHASLAGLKASGGKLATAFPDAGARTAVLQTILQAVRSIDRDKIRRRIATGKSPLHGVERSKPGVIVRYEKATSAQGTAALHEPAASYRAPKRKKRAARG
jgi:hypothetical protein